MAKHTVDIAIQDPQWNIVEDLEPLTREVIRRTLLLSDTPNRAEGRTYEISVVFVNDDMIRVLNREYRGKDKATNVLSFAMMDDEDSADGEVIALGDIILAYETIEDEAKKNERFMRDHVAHLLAHGCLHLLGYDHLEEDDANIMETLEIRILEGMNIQNPYLQKI